MKTECWLAVIVVGSLLVFMIHTTALIHLSSYREFTKRLGEV